MLRSSTRRTVLAVTAAVVLVTACGGDDDDDADPDTTGGTAVATATPGADRRRTTAGLGARRRRAATTPADVDPDATLRYGAANLVTRFDAHKSSNGYDQNWLAPVYDRLIWQTPEVELEPGLATEWGFTDDLHFEMTLRDGVTFSDGTPFDAAAVAANIDRAKNVEGSGLAAYLASVDTVEVVDPTHVRFVLNRPDATLPMQLATRPGMMISPAAFENPDLDSNPVGSGPYELVEYREGDMAAYERRDDYWNPDYAGVKRIELYYIPDSTTRLNGLRTGALDATPLDPAADRGGRGHRRRRGHASATRSSCTTSSSTARRASSATRSCAGRWPTPSTASRSSTPSSSATARWPRSGSRPTRRTTSTTSASRRRTTRSWRASCSPRPACADGFTFDAMTSVQPTFVKLGRGAAGHVRRGRHHDERHPGAEPGRRLLRAQRHDAIVSAYPGRIDPAETAQIYFNDESFSNPGRQNDPEVQQAWIDSLVPGDDRPERLEALLRAIDEPMPNLPMLYPQIPIAATDKVNGLVYYQSGHIEFAGVTMSP